MARSRQEYYLVSCVCFVRLVQGIAGELYDFEGTSNRIDEYDMWAHGDNSSFLNGTFPDGFMWGVASSSYQIEGGWNDNGKGENIWDRYTHLTPSHIDSGDNGDIACDSYNKWMEDIQLLKNMGVKYYRFSLSWSRLLPNGTVDNPNPDGIRYYNDIINNLTANNIQPLVTLYHWDLPQALQDLGGWPSNDLIPYFANYSRFCFNNFGDRVQLWITFNEPEIFAGMYETGVGAPGISSPGVAFYQIAETVLKSHATAWHIYDNDFRPTQKGKVGITLVSDWYTYKTDTRENRKAANVMLQFQMGIFAHPIFSKSGGFPPLVIHIVDRNSRREGLDKSRLPTLNQTWIEYIKGTFDFFGFNHYTTSLCELGNDNFTVPSLANDEGVITSYDPYWPSTAISFLKVVPWGLRSYLNWLNTEYNHPPIIVTENGFSDNDGHLDDTERIDFYRDYINEMLKSVIIDGVNVQGYFAWSLMDNFEWIFGYTKKFGVNYVDFNNETRPRTPKLSSSYLASIYNNNGFL